MSLSLPMYDDASANGAIATTPEVDAMLAANCPVAIGISGGKDSTAVAIATIEYLDSIGHTGPRILVHADLGATEWKASLPTCERLAKHLGVELVVVRRKQGDMMDRWEQRWNDNVTRWEELSCVKLILPWSTPDMRFCTSELKVDQICRMLCKRFPGQEILNATGIRRQESSQRAKAPIAKAQKKLESKTHKTTGMDWHPIIDWSIEDVWDCIDSHGFPRHEAYTVYGASRVSCVWCILATKADHVAGTRAAENHDLGRRMATLEIRSTFAFQGSHWLGDTITDILTDEQRTAIQHAKERAERREAAEAKIPKHLLYTRDWPTCVPTWEEAALLAAVRFQVADAVGIKPTFCSPDAIIKRYRELMAMKAARDAKTAAKATKKAKKLAVAA